MPIIKRSSLPGSPAAFSVARMRSPDLPEGAEGINGGVHAAGPSQHAQAQPQAKDGLIPGGGELRTVNALVSKLVNKLPCNSGLKLSQVEADGAARASVASLKQLSRVRLPLVVYSLVQALETLGKYSASSSTPLPGLLDSQVHLLVVLNACLDHTRRDPIPFDDQLARYLLATILSYASHLQLRESERTPRSRERELSASSSRLGLSRRADSPNPSPVPQPGTDKLAAQLRPLIGYVTASNWPLAMTRIRSRISYLCTTIDEAPDLTDLHLVQYAQLDRSRLAQLIQEFSSSFLHIKRHAQGPVAIALRQTIWNWIDTHPEQCLGMIESGRKLEGGPDVLFDALYSAADISSSSAVKRTRAFYPLMAMLLVLCPDIMRRVAMEPGRSGNMAKKVSYVESLRKGLATSRGFEACASSYVDLISAAGRLGSMDGCGLKLLVPDFQADLENALLSSTEIGTDIIVDGLVGLYRENRKPELFVKLLSSESKRIPALQAARTLLADDKSVVLRQDIAFPLRSLIKAGSDSRVLAEALRLIALDPAIAYEGSHSHDLLMVVASLTSGPKSLRRLAGDALVAVMEWFGRTELGGSVLGICLSDPSRQCLQDLEILDLEAMTESLAVLNDILGATTRLRADMSAIPSIITTSQALIGALVVLDSRTASGIMPNLKVVQSLLRSALPKIDDEAKARLAMYDVLVDLPPALGRQHYQRNFRQAARSFKGPSPVLTGLWTLYRGIIRGLAGKISRGDASDDDVRIWQDMLAVTLATTGICLAGTEPSIQALEGLIAESLALLGSANVVVKETVKEALGSELPAACAPVLVQQLNKSFAPESTEVVIAILRLTAERSRELDVGEIVVAIGRHLHRMHRDDAVRLRARFYSMLEVVLSNGSTLGSARANVVFDWLVDWCELREDGHGEKNEPLKALSLLSEGLALQPPGGEGDAQSAVRSRLFHRAYSYLARVIDREGPDSAPAITTLSHLLSANLDVGLKHCLAMGYHEDTVTRTAFMQVLSATLRSGAQLSAGVIKAAAVRPYLDLLSAGNMAMAVACVEVCPGHGAEVDEMSTALFRSCEARGTLLPFLRVLVEREVALTNHESELFRANSITTRMLTLFAKTYGYNYVRATLQPLIYSLIDKPAETSFELDPSKAAGTDDIERNAEHLKLMCQALLDLICSSTPRIPVMLRALCHYIWESVEDRYPESRHSAVGSFIFLRFFCPSIVAPDNIDLEIPADSRDLRRGLLLITKVIQNLANNIVFGNKEPHMKVLNPFLGENIRQVTKFLSDVAIRPRSHEIAGVVRACKEEGARLQDAEGDDAVLNRFIRKHQPRLEAALAQLPNSYRQLGSTRPERTPLDGRAALSKLKAVEPSKPVPVQPYDEFMRHHAGRSTESVANMFYEGPEGQSGRRIFYFIVSNIGLADYELVGYRVFQLLIEVGEAFDVVLDLTGYAASTEVPLPWLGRMLQVCPPRIVSLVHTLALYNPNTFARRRLRRIAAEVPFHVKHVVAASSPLELQEYIHYSSLALPERTMELAYEAVKLYTNLVLVGDHDMHMKVGIKVGGDCLQIASWRQLDLTANLKSYIVDVIAFSDIDDLVPGAGADADRLEIKYNSTESMMLIARDDSLDAARAARVEFESVIRARIRETPVLLSERALRPSDIPGTLLNMALLNLVAPDEGLRLAAYRLVGEVAQFFNYDLGARALKVETGLLLPHHSLGYAVDVSRQLAAVAPDLTLDFLKEWTIGFDKAGRAMQIAALHYVGPWLGNLAEVGNRPEVAEVVRGFISVTIAEYADLHLLLQEKIWKVVGTIRGDVVLNELLAVGLDAGIGSMRADCIADILVSVASTPVRGKLIARLRKLIEKTIAQTYLAATQTLPENALWGEICLLLRLNAMLAFNPASPIDAQLYLPETLHVLTMLAGVGPPLVRQTAYGLCLNTLRTLAAVPPTGEVDSQALLELLGRAQGVDAKAWFEGGAPGLPEFLSEVLVAAAVSMDCANAWRARWMSFVAGTCFQHNSATQPQAFTVLGCLATEEVDDDLVFQILVAMSSALNTYSDADTPLVVSMLTCLARVMPGIMDDSRYATCLLWLAVGVLQMGHLPLFSPALELLCAALRAMQRTGYLQRGLSEGLLESRVGAGEAARRLDQLAGVSFETDVGFAMLGVVWKGTRHPSTRAASVEVLRLLISLGLGLGLGSEGAVNGDKQAEGHGQGREKEEEVLPYRLGLMPILEVEMEGVQREEMFGTLSIRDNATALLVVSLVVTMLQTAATDAERVVLYKFLAQASADIPEVLAMMYDALIPRMTAVLGSTSNVGIQEAITTILERAMQDETYAFPAATSGSITGVGASTSVGPGLGLGAGAGMGESSTSLALGVGTGLAHQKSYSASISSLPSRQGAGATTVTGSGAGAGAGELVGGLAVLDEMGMRGLGEMAFVQNKERVAQMARWVSAMITLYTT